MIVFSIYVFKIFQAQIIVKVTGEYKIQFIFNFMYQMTDFLSF